MSLVLENIAKNGALNGCWDLLNGGTLNICEGAVVAATLTLANPCCAAAASGQKTFNAITEDTSAAGTAGDVDNGKFYTSGSALHSTASVGLTNAEIILTSLSIPADAEVYIDTGTIST